MPIGRNPQLRGSGPYPCGRMRHLRGFTDGPADPCGDHRHSRCVVSDHAVTLLRYRGGSEMRVLRNDLDRYSFERVHVSEFYPLSDVCPLPPVTRQDRMVGAVASASQGDAILKCLDRDDPLRHRYLRRRWRAV